MRLKTMARRKTRLEQLEALLLVLAESIDNQPGARDLAQLSKQYRETLAEIDELKGDITDDDEISNILADREDSGKPGAIRKGRTAV